MGLRLRLIAVILQFLSICLSFPILHVYIENLYENFLRWYWNLEMGIHMDDELWFGLVESQAHCSNSSLYLSIFLSFQEKIVSHFPGTIKARHFIFSRQLNKK